MDSRATDVGSRHSIASRMMASPQLGLTLHFTCPIPGDDELIIDIRKKMNLNLERPCAVLIRGAIGPVQHRPWHWLWAAASVCTDGKWPLHRLWNTDDAWFVGHNLLLGRPWDVSSLRDTRDLDLQDNSVASQSSPLPQQITADTAELGSSGNPRPVSWCWGETAVYTPPGQRDLVIPTHEGSIRDKTRDKTKRPEQAEPIKRSMFLRAEYNTIQRGRYPLLESILDAYSFHDCLQS
eukprot:1136681-Pelagomonas_calceolata.AAC.7